LIKDFLTLLLFVYLPPNGESQRVEKERVREKSVGLEGKGVGELGDIFLKI
jgi:hypothetical protein